MACGQEPDEKEADEEEEERGVQTDLDAGKAEEGKGDDEVEKAPEEIHDGTGEALAGRSRKRGGEWLAAQSAGEVRDGIAQECAGEEVGHEAEEDGEHHIYGCIVFRSPGGGLRR